MKLKTILITSGIIAGTVFLSSCSREEPFDQNGMKKCYLLNLNAKFGYSANYFLNTDKNDHIWSNAQGRFLDPIFPPYYSPIECKNWLKEQGILVSFEEAKKNRQLNLDGKINSAAHTHYEYEALYGNLFKKQKETYDSKNKADYKPEKLKINVDWKPAEAPRPKLRPITF